MKLAKKEMNLFSSLKACRLIRVSDSTSQGFLFLARMSANYACKFNVKLDCVNLSRLHLKLSH